MCFEPETMFFQFYLNNLNGIRLDRCGLKSECDRFEYGTNLMASKFNKVKLNILNQRIIDFRVMDLCLDFPEGTQEAPRRHPGGTQKAPRATERLQRRKSCKTIVFYSKNVRDRPFRLDETRVTLTKPCKN